MMRLPDFIIAGAQKCGTTTLHHALALHERIFMSEPKELSFFDKNFDRGIAWYANSFEGVPLDVLAGESTPDYIWDPDFPKRFADAIPDGKLIILLRNPVERAYSAYLHAVRYGWESLPFEEALKKENERWKQDPGQHDLFYLQRSKYADQMENVFRYVDSSKVLVLISEEYFASPEKQLGVVLDFLGLQYDAGFLQRAAGLKRNVGREPRWALLQSIVGSSADADSLITKLISKLNLKKKTMDKMRAETRKHLHAELASSTRRLEAMLGRSLSLWD